MGKFLAFGQNFGHCLLGGHCERFLRSNLSKTEFATPQEEHLRLAMTTIFLDVRTFVLTSGNFGYGGRKSIQK
jgi:hypothetical protein